MAKYLHTWYKYDLSSPFPPLPETPPVYGTPPPATNAGVAPTPMLTEAELAYVTSEAQYRFPYTFEKTRHFARLNGVKL